MVKAFPPIRETLSQNMIKNFIQTNDLKEDRMFEPKMNNKVAVIGLGYVGLPLLCHISTKYPCMGLDISEKRIAELSSGIDNKNCIDKEYLQGLKNVKLTTDWNALRECNIFIVSAPTPIDEHRLPDITSLKNICSKLGEVITPGSIIIFESTVAPGTTEDICIPLIEESASMSLNKDFAVGFSPERINVGDKIHTLTTVPKVISASTPSALSVISELYANALGCKTVTAPSIKTAEAVKIYENVQRDVLIALANQYSEYCQAEGIDIYEVTRCAATKWNFAEVYPGLVGGHCIGVDPYYLISKANCIGINMDLVEKARKVNEAETLKVIDKILSSIKSENAKNVLLVGLTYKPNTSDLRNSKALEIAVDISKKLSEVSLYDPHVSKSDLPAALQPLYCEELPDDYDFDAVITLVSHSSVKSPVGKKVNIHIFK
ncbi:MAG: nucleotide sugar dehydrogenase [Bacteroides sp.]|nr:nucleotide sugar dehydrogenase [Bacteroides sp.]